MRHLRCAEHDELIESAIPMAENAASLEGRHALSCRPNLALHLDRRCSLYRLKISAYFGVQKYVVAPVFVHKCRGRCTSGFQHVNDRRQISDVHLHLHREIFGESPCRSDTHRNGFPDLPNLVSSKWPLVGWLEPGKAGNRPDWIDTHQVVHRENPIACVTGLRDPTEDTMGDWRSNEGDIESPGEADIGDKLSSSLEESIVLFAQ
jgi:hypothetical protein